MDNCLVLVILHKCITAAIDTHTVSLMADGAIARMDHFFEVIWDRRYLVKAVCIKDPTVHDPQDSLPDYCGNVIASATLLVQLYEIHT